MSDMPLLLGSTLTLAISLFFSFFKTFHSVRLGLGLALG